MENWMVVQKSGIQQEPVPSVERQRGGGSQVVLGNYTEVVMIMKGAVSGLIGNINVKKLLFKIEVEKPSV